MKIAIVSSGLCHVRRGVETWAATLAVALAERAHGAESMAQRGERRGADGSVLLTVGTRIKTENSRLDDSIEVTLFVGSGVTGCKEQVTCKMHVMPCWRRGTRRNAWLTALLSPLGGWRYGFGSDYQTEQTTMAPGLVGELKKGGFDIVHLQDPWLALLLQKAGKRGRHPAKVILAHGTEERMDFLEKLDHVQELSPAYLAHHAGRTHAGQTRHAIPNCVDVKQFSPGHKKEFRNLLGIPEDAFVVLSVGAVDHMHKRMDWLVDEFASIKNDNAQLIISGSCSSADGRKLLDRAEAKLGRRFRSFCNIPHAKMPDLYRVADVFVLCSMTEIFGIAFLEAMASGIPCIGHKYPVTEWIIGEKDEGGNLRPEVAGGKCLDMSSKNVLSGFLSGVTPEWIAEHGEPARKRAEQMFSHDVVVGRILRMYEQITEKKPAV